MKIKEIDYSDAIIFWNETLDPGIFTHPAILLRLAHSVRWFAFVKGTHIKCVWPLCWNEYGQIVTPPFTYWVGPLWSNSRGKIAKHSHLAEETQVFENYIEFFENCGYYVHFELPVSMLDVRVFDWWNYNKDKLSEFEITPRYTAQINLKDFEVSQFRRNRKRQIRDFDSNLFNVSNASPTYKDLVSLYEGEIEKSVTSDVRQGIISLIEIADLGFGSYTSVYDKVTEELCGFSLSLSSRNQANHVLNLTKLDSKKAGLHAWLTLAEIQAANLNGKTIFDFNGANSPKRGDDKHSYGASYRLYFALRQKLVS